MRALKINFDGPNQVSLDWGSEVEGASGVAQRAGVSVMTQAGSDKLIPSRGTSVASTLFSYGVFDLLGMQHTLNFGSLKAVDDMKDFEDSSRADADSIDKIKMALIDVKDNVAYVGVQVTTATGAVSNEITTIQ